MAANEAITYDRRELSAILRSFKAMDAQASEEAKKVGFELATYALGEIRKTAQTRTVNPQAVRRIAEGAKASKTSKIGEISIGFASQRFSGGGSTQKLWPGFEFGSNRYPQFPNRTPRSGVRGNSGYFIYPTLRRIQPELIQKWEESFATILKKWS